MTRVHCPCRRRTVLAALAAGCSVGGSDRVGGERDTPRACSRCSIRSQARRSSPTSPMRWRACPTARCRSASSPRATRTDRLRDGHDPGHAARPRRPGDGGQPRLGRVRRPSLRALHAPLLIDSYLVQERVLQSGLAARMLDRTAAAGPRGHRDPARPHAPSARPSGTASLPRTTSGADVGDRAVACRRCSPCVRSAPARCGSLPEVRSVDGLDGVVHRSRDRQSDRFGCRGLAAHDQRQPLATAAGALRRAQAPTAG